ncbi:hypothetical protein MNBD_ACTINO02-846 [hydrothermal vent metagenome]|uniref:Uncharacterized protein n=1 Tax=hydrothermal vent metagenome TaxID=652676 RepID=A0A3B0TFD2_9ZZZZ
MNGGSALAISQRILVGYAQNSVFGGDRSSAGKQSRLARCRDSWVANEIEVYGDATAMGESIRYMANAS